jgi:hypothetical protein
MRQRLWGGLVRRNFSEGGFTLLELISAMATLAMLTALLFGAIDQANRAWLTSENRVETFTQARAALDFMSREISQAITTNTIPFLAQESTMQLGTISPVTLYFGNIAFVASVGNGASDGMDLMEVVYRLSMPSVAGGPEPSQPGPPVIPGVFVDAPPGPYKLVRRISPYSPATPKYWDYGSQGLAPAAPWDFYGTPIPPTWPETSWRDGTQVLAENVISLQFAFCDDQNANPANPYNYWNSTATLNAWQTELGGVGVPGTVGPHMQDHAPSRVIITLKMLDSRAASRYKATSDPNAKERIYQESQRTFTTSVYIPHR